MGGNVLARSAVRVAEAAGLSQLAIGLTIVAFGTTVPELATSVVAARRGEGDVAVGNAVGSVLFNTACVLGLASALRPINISWDVYAIKLPVMIALVLVLVPFVRTGSRVSRWEGALLVGRGGLGIPAEVSRRGGPSAGHVGRRGEIRLESQIHV